jgi:hypothetical protein
VTSIHGALNSPTNVFTAPQQAIAKSASEA